jgi:hypothetical protein
MGGEPDLTLLEISIQSRCRVLRWHILGVHHTFSMWCDVFMLRCVRKYGLHIAHAQSMLAVALLVTQASVIELLVCAWLEASACRCSELEVLGCPCQMLGTWQSCLFPVIRVVCAKGGRGEVLCSSGGCHTSASCSCRQMILHNAGAEHDGMRDCDAVVARSSWEEGLPSVCAPLTMRCTAHWCCHVTLTSCGAHQLWTAEREMKVWHTQARCLVTISVQLTQSTVPSLSRVALWGRRRLADCQAVLVLALQLQTDDSAQ